MDTFGSATSTMSAADFRRRFLWLIILTWNIPPLVGMCFILLFGVLTPQQVIGILTSPLEPAYIVFWSIFAFWFFRRKMQVISDWLDQKPETMSSQVFVAVRRFPLQYWGLFLFYLLFAPVSVVIAADIYTDFVMTPLALFRIELIALIVSIIVGLPIFFMVMDLFGHAMSGVVIERPVVTIKTKVFLIGALIPLLIDTMLVQYYWTRTGFFTLETFGVWLILELLAIGGSLVFVHSFGQSLSPLQKVVNPSTSLQGMDFSLLQAKSTDELGVLSERYRELLNSQVLANQQLSKSRAEFEAMFNSISDGVIYADTQRKIVMVNPAMTGLFGYSFPELHGRTTGLLYANPDDYEDQGRQRYSAEAEANLPLYEMQYRRKDGSVFVGETYGTKVIDDEGNVIGLLGIIRDITEQKNAADRETSLGKILDSSLNEIYIFDTDTLRFILVNQGALANLGYTIEEMKQLTPLDLKPEFTDTMFSELLLPLRNGKQEIIQFSTIHERKDGSTYPVEVHLQLSTFESRPAFSAIILDITARKQDEETIRFMAHHDPLTGLTNRYEFEHRAEQLLEHTKNSDTTHALLYIDLDQFKIINDTCGHMAGDAMLKKIAAVLSENTDKNDIFARLGGDEFGVLIEHTNLAEANVIAEEFLDVIKSFRFVWDDKIFSVGASIGMVLISASSASVSELLSAADVACYAAKDMGRNRIHIYSEEDAELVKRHGQMQWVSRITGALEEDRFTMYAQCIVPANGTGSTHKSYELLVRMVDENDQLVQPGAFLPAAERFDLMPALDRWVVGRAFEYLRGLSEKHTDGAASTLFVNLSGVTLGDREFVDYVLDFLKSTDSSRSRICFEITETAAITNLNQAIAFINAVKQEGCQIALDDFGSGMSSFSYLRTLPIDYVKFDGSIIRGILDDPMNAAIVASVNQIAHSAGLQTIAEWVETAAIQGKLLEMGIDYVQGYAIQGPRPLADFPDACICSL